jgi:glutathione S-transferase
MGSGASKAKPTLYMYPLSAPCRSVMMTALAIGTPLELKHIDLFKGEQKEEAYLKINPDHVVPTLVDGPLRLWESRAIMAYLIDQYSPNHNLYPRDPCKRAQVDRMLQYDLANLGVVGEFMRPQFIESKPADPEKAAKVEKVLDYLENKLKEHDYIAAPHLTIADLSITAMLGMLEIKDWSFERWPKVSHWRQRIREEKWYAEANKGLLEFNTKAA